MPTLTRLRLPLVSVLVGACLVSTAACGDETRDEAASSDAACAAFSAYSGHRGTTVTIFSPIRDVEADRLQKSWEKFSGCTEITIKYEGSESFETEIGTRVAAGNLPDLGFFPQPGLLGTLARSGALKPAAPAVGANVRKWYSPEWLHYGTVDGTFYAAPLDASVKSFVWYSPSFFASKGYQVPTTWAELLALTERIAQDGVKPWCVGIESGVATGWPLTDWLEDVVLRAYGPDVYDDWVAHRIPFDDPRIVSSLDQVGKIVRDPRYVNGGYGGLPSVVTTSYQEGGLPILEGGCALHRQASFYANHWPVGAKIAQDGDVYAFYLPPINAAVGHPVLGAGSFVGAFATRPEVQAVATYLSTPDWVNSRASLGGAVNASRSLDRKLLHTPIDELSAKLLTDESTTFRFDGSDTMPGAVGSGTFWTGMTDWAKGADSKTVLSRIEASWPRR